jgi:hypothetical protein
MTDYHLFVQTKAVGAGSQDFALKYGDNYIDIPDPSIYSPTTYIAFDPGGEFIDVSVWSSFYNPWEPSSGSDTWMTFSNIVNNTGSGNGWGSFRVTAAENSSGDRTGDIDIISKYNGTWNIDTSQNETTTSTIVLNFANEVNLSDADLVQDRYWQVTTSGWQSGDQIDINITTDATLYSGTETFSAYYRIGGGTWVQVVSRTTTGSNNVTIPNLAYDSSTDFRLRIGDKTESNADFCATITGGSFDSGSGSISVGSFDTECVAIIS